MSALRVEIAALCGGTCLLLMAGACNTREIVLGLRTRVDAAAGTTALPGDAGAGVGATAGRGEDVDVPNTQGATGRPTQTGLSGPTTSGTPAAGGGGGMAALANAGAGAIPALGSPGCGLAPPATDTSIRVADKTASYIVDLPPSYDNTRPYPLVLTFRRSDVTAAQFRAQLKLAQVVGADAIVVHSNSLDDASSWDVQRDLPLFDALLAQTRARYCIDDQRVFALGDGIGGYFAGALGCLRGDKLRAVAAHAPGVPPSYNCQGDVAVWIAQAAGDGPLAVANSRSARDFWATSNGCDTATTTAVEPKPCVELAGCRPGLAVRYCEYDGNGPELPAFAASGMWRFFASL